MVSGGGELVSGGGDVLGGGLIGGESDAAMSLVGVGEVVVDVGIEEVDEDDAGGAGVEAQMRGRAAVGAHTPEACVATRD